eukprot:m.1637678 g.1637678  ORF g.1637678 m.1637678 type:complete len:493 (+) comp26012_c0_seq1:440-1918(+)
MLRRNMTLNKKGSAPLEQNHSSIAAMIGSSNDDITRMVSALLSREVERTKAESTFLARQLLKSFQHAEGKGDGQPPELLKFVSRELSSWGARLIQEQYEMSQSFLREELPHGRVQLKNTKDGSVLTHNFAKCSCSFSNMFGLPCRHYIAATHCTEFPIPSRWKKHTAVRLADGPGKAGHSGKDRMSIDTDTTDNGNDGMLCKDDATDEVASDDMSTGQHQDIDRNHGPSDGGNNAARGEEPESHASRERIFGVARRRPTSNPYNDIVTSAKEIAEQYSVLSQEAVSYVLGTFEAIKEAAGEVSKLHAVGEHVDSAFRFKTGRGLQKRPLFAFERGGRTAQRNVVSDNSQVDENVESCSNTTALEGTPVANPGKRRTCTLCGLQGHNKQTCSTLRALGKRVPPSFFHSVLESEAYEVDATLSHVHSSLKRGQHAIVIKNILAGGYVENVDDLVIQGFAVGSHTKIPDDCSMFGVGDVLQWVNTATNREIIDGR